MTDFWQGLLNGIAATSLWEWLAVALAIAYLLLIVRENILGWYAAFFSTLIYTFLFWDVSLLMESALQIYYMAMAIYGWSQWRKSSDQNAERAIQVWSLQRHVLIWTATAILSGISGYLLSANTEASWPYLDSMTTWSSVLVTYMVAKKVLENWLYWIVINSVSIFLYLDKGLELTAVLFVIYVILSVMGFFTWFASYKSSHNNKYFHKKAL